MEKRFDATIEEMTDEADYLMVHVWDKVNHRSITLWVKAGKDNIVDIRGHVSDSLTDGCKDGFDFYKGNVDMTERGK